MQLFQIYFRWLSVLALFCAASPAVAQSAWTNGKWFDGSKFVSRTMYSTEAGLLTSKRPARIKNSIDLQGRYVVPAYGDSHHHGINGAAGLDEKIATFLGDGIFYVKNPNVIPDFLTPDVRARINRTDSIDVAFANGGITGSGGHPGPLHARLAANGVFPGLTKDEMAGRAYFNIDRLQELEAAWPTILRGKPDFIKLFLNGRAHLAHGDAAGTRVGVSPEVLSAIVQRAHLAGLRVTAHVDTADDFALAVRSGVDELGHMPAYDPGSKAGLDAFLISPEAAAEAGRRDIVVVPTASVSQRMAGKRWTEEQRRNSIEVHRRNLATLIGHGVKLAAGSDGISGESPMVTAKSEIQFLNEHGLADNLALLRMWAVTTPQTIFPNRKIGELRSGYEANFLVLDGNPLLDAAKLHSIAMRVKSGQLIPPPEISGQVAP